ncbi:MAG TPA: FKBP-type peptidyl-prolyl cis-trans isomerase [Candidatus Paceibacterota bacterium]
MNQKTLYTGIAVAIAIVVVGYFFYSGSMTPSQNPTNNPSAPFMNSAQENTQNAIPQNSVTIQDVKTGDGTEAVAGMQVSVNYIGKLQNGTTFDASANHGGPFTFTLGAGQVIPGWEQGIAGMKVGGERILVIPPALGYGAQQVGPIPANSTLIFDVQLVGVSTSTTPAQ